VGKPSGYKIQDFRGSLVNPFIRFPPLDYWSIFGGTIQDFASRSGHELTSLRKSELTFEMLQQTMFAGEVRTIQLNTDKTLQSLLETEKQEQDLLQQLVYFVLGCLVASGSAVAILLSLFVYCKGSFKKIKQVV